MSNTVEIKITAQAQEARAALDQLSGAFTTKMREVQATVESASTSVDTSVVKMTRRINDVPEAVGNVDASVGRMTRSLQAVPVAIGGMAASLGAIGAVSAAMYGVSRAAVENERSVFTMSKTFGERTGYMLAEARRMSEGMKGYFSQSEIQYAFTKTADSMQRYGITGRQYMDLVARASDVAAAKNMSLRDSIDRLESAMRGEAEASEYLGVTLNDTFMKNMAFNGSLKESWETLDDNVKSHYRLVEMLDQTSKYTGSAKEATSTLSGALSALANTLMDRLSPALSVVTGKLAAFVNLVTSAVRAQDVMGRQAEITGKLAAEQQKLNDLQQKQQGFFGGFVDPKAVELASRNIEKYKTELRDLYRYQQLGAMTPATSSAPTVEPNAEKVLKQARDNLDQQRAIAANAGAIKDWSAAKEVEHWKTVLRAQKEGSEAARQVYQELGKAIERYEAEKVRAEKAGSRSGAAGAREAAREARERYQADMAGLRLALEEQKDSAEERVAIAGQMADRAAREYGRESREYIEMLRLMEQETRRHTEEISQLREMEIESAVDRSSTELDLRLQYLQTAREIGAISAQQELEETRKIQEEKYLIELTALYDRLALRELDVVEQARIYREMERLQNEHRLRMGQVEQRQVLESRNRWQSMTQGVINLFGNAVRSLVTGSQTVAQAMQSLFMGLLDVIISKIMEMIAAWVVGLIFGKTTSASLATGKAAEGAAAAGASVAHIPYWGWAAAPGVAAQTYGILMGFAGMASAAGGWDIPSDAIARVHAREMVLPAHLAERVRDMTEPGGSGGLTVHIHATDQRSFVDQMRRSGSDLNKMLKRAYRDFHLRPRPA